MKAFFTAPTILIILIAHSSAKEMCPSFGKLAANTTANLETLNPTSLNCSTSGCNKFACSGTFPQQGKATNNIRISGSVKYCTQEIDLDLQVNDNKNISFTLKSGANNLTVLDNLNVQFTTDIKKDDKHFNVSITADIMVVIQTMLGEKTIHKTLVFGNVLENVCGNESAIVSTNKPLVTTKVTVSKVKVTSKPKVTTPAVKPKVTTPAVKPKVTTPAVKPKVTTPAVKPKVTTPAVKPKVTTPAVKPKETTPAVKPKVTTAVKTKVTTTVKTKPTTPKSVKPARTSKTTKAVSLIFAVLILAIVLAIAIYCRKKRRLSNLPAYYNDIVINDPLKLDADSDTAEDNATNNADNNGEMYDDDELPLFS